MNSGLDSQPDAFEADFATMGSYEPAFIHLNINTCEDLSDINKLGQTVTSTFCFGSAEMTGAEW